MQLMISRALCDHCSAFLEHESGRKNRVEISGYKAGGIMPAVWYVWSVIGTIIGLYLT
ncbi:hypothetical protein VCR14J2_390300 [Vibrio coralliirubri]|nr:hypothetical protein VCR14J2_390300 [Vibrio coralliirubri]